MSVVSSVKTEDQDGFYGGQRKRPLSIIEENDGDEGDAGTSPDKGDVVKPAPEINTKEITIETKTTSTPATKLVARNNGVKKNDSKKKPQNIDTSRAKTLNCGSKPKSPSSPDSKTSCNILHFPKCIRMAPKTDSNSKVPPPVAPKPKTPSPSPSKLKSPSFPVQTTDRHFAFHKASTCSQSKKIVSKSKTSDTQTNEEEVTRSMKNIVKRTVSKIENHVASMASSTKQKVKVDPPRRKLSKEEAPDSKLPFREKQNATATPKLRIEAGKSGPTSTSVSSSKETQEFPLTLTPAIPKDSEKATDSPVSMPSSEKVETPTHTQPCTPSSKETEITTDSPDSTSTSDRKEIPTDTQTCKSSSKEKEIATGSPDSTPTSDNLQNLADTQMCTPSFNEEDKVTGSPDSTSTSDNLQNLTDTQMCTPSFKEEDKATGSSDSARTSNNLESATDTQMCRPSSKETGIVESSLPTTQVSNETENHTAVPTPASNETENPIVSQTTTSPSQEMEKSTATHKSTPASNATDHSTVAITSTQPTDDAEKLAAPQTSTTLSSGTVAIKISAPNHEAEKQTVIQISQPPSSEPETSSSNDMEVEDVLRYQVENSQWSTSESTTPEFTTPPTSPPLPQPKQISNVLLSSLLSSKTSHSSPELPRTTGSGPNSKSGQILSDGQGLARIREAAESLKLTSSSPLVPKASPSPPSRRVPFSFRQSPKLSHRPFSEAYSISSLNNAKPMGSLNLNVLSLPPQFSARGDSGTSDSETEDKCQNKTVEKSRIAPRSPFLMPKFHPRRGSYFFKRRLSSESLASLSENESTDNAEESTPISASDFNQLKETADRLRLSTRRPSVLQWRQQYVESPGASALPFRNGMNGDSFDEKLTSERKQKIDEALDWLRNELHEMRSQDQMLARQLLTIRNDIHQLKLRRFTTEHQELLDDFKLEIEEQQEFSDVLDIPQPIYEDNPLKHIGVTRLNISARRFSAC